eukprot:TRINITY_DN8795_c0_g1_i2.p1 TRINITY_DN8795_c0_g1~~TRINITY_DN8795_c0_g1_i2.p1  ORF type:complete len:348 (-),score=62.91 TRINITY_DN8795_c0_g1_i2:220-1263(-)
MKLKFGLRFRHKKKPIPITTPTKANTQKVDDGNTSAEYFQQQREKRKIENAKKRSNENKDKKTKSKKKKNARKSPREVLLERKVVELKRELKVGLETWNTSRQDLESRLSRAKQTISKQEQLLIQQRKTIANTELLDSTKIEKKYLREKMLARVLSEQQSKLTLQKQGLIEQRGELLEKLKKLAKENDTLKELLKTHHVTIDTSNTTACESTSTSNAPIQPELLNPAHSPPLSPTFSTSSKIEQEVDESIRTGSPILQVSARDLSSLRHKKLCPNESFCYIPFPPPRPIKLQRHSFGGTIKLVTLKTRKWDCLNSAELLKELEIAHYEKVKSMYLEEKNTRALSPQP